MSKVLFESDNLYFVNFERKHISDIYLSWLNDAEIVKYSELRHSKHDFNTAVEYLNSMNNSSNEFLAMIQKKSHKHIGNISIYNDYNNYISEISLLIGERLIWGNGFGYEAWDAAIQYVFSKKIRKIYAGAMKSNKAMLGIIHKSGMHIESILKKHFLLEGMEEDMIKAVLYRDD